MCGTSSRPYPLLQSIDESKMSSPLLSARPASAPSLSLCSSLHRADEKSSLLLPQATGHRVDHPSSSATRPTQPATPSLAPHRHLSSVELRHCGNSPSGELPFCLTAKSSSIPHWRALANLPTPPGRRLARILAGAAAPCHGGTFPISPAGSWGGQFRPMVNRKLYSFPRNFSVNQFKVQTLKFN
jgi:hypothetical protein